jgi:hypothetical protein
MAGAWIPNQVWNYREVARLHRFRMKSGMTLGTLDLNKYVNCEAEGKPKGVIPAKAGIHAQAKARETSSFTPTGQHVDSKSSLE